MKLILVIIFASVCTLLSFAEPSGSNESETAPAPATAVNPKLTQPKLSPAGVQRINKNLITLTQNLKDLGSNLEIGDRNVKTLEEEISDLNSLEKESQGLKKKYSDYLTDAKSKLSLGIKQSRNLATKGPPEANAKADSEAANKLVAANDSGKNQLAEWRQDANLKIGRVAELMKELQTNLSEIQGRRDNLKTQLSSWHERLREFKKLSEAFKTKKNELEKMLSN